MDDRLQKGLAHANYRVAIHQQRENLKIRLRENLLYAHNGGIFSITPTLISFIDCMIGKEHKSIVLIDDRGAPILIEDLDDFQSRISARYHESTNEYYTEYEKLKKARSVQTLVGL